MKAESTELKKIIETLYSQHKDTKESFASIQLNEDAWSIKEIFGHLIDSAANNYQRFIRLQEQESLDFPGYSPDWVKLIPYNSYPFSSLLNLWKEYNLLLCHIFENIKPDTENNIWKTEKGDLTLKFLVEDYISHLELHMDHLDKRMKELADHI